MWYSWTNRAQQNTCEKWNLQECRLQNKQQRCPEEHGPKTKIHYARSRWDPCFWERRTRSIKNMRKNEDKRGRWSSSLWFQLLSRQISAAQLTLRTIPAPAAARAAPVGPRLASTSSAITYSIVIQSYAFIVNEYRSSKASFWSSELAGRSNALRTG